LRPGGGDAQDVLAAVLSCACSAASELVRSTETDTSGMGSPSVKVRLPRASVVILGWMARPSTVPLTSPFATLKVAVLRPVKRGPYVSVMVEFPDMDVMLEFPDTDVMSKE
jgi:hypothetical protein